MKKHAGSRQPFRPLSPGELSKLREKFLSGLKGESIASWALRNQLPPRSVYDLLQGRVRGLRGDSYRAAELIAQAANAR